MKNNKYFRIDLSRGLFPSMRGMGMALALGICGVAGSAMVHAQATTGSVFGWAPVGQTVTAQSENGFKRHAKVNDRGRYSMGSLPMGVYTVTLENDGQPVEKHVNVSLTVGAGREVDFTCGGVKCSQESSKSHA
jgi:hypothetical protein